MASIHSRAHDEFSVPLYIDSEGRIVPLNAGRTPLVRWPDGHWCTEANLYMLSMLEAGRSRKGRGGSLATEAYHIGHLLHYVFAQKKRIIDLIDRDFIEFITKTADLRVKDRLGERRVSARTRRAIGRTALRFLAFVGELYGDDHFVGKSGRIAVVETRSRRNPKWGAKLISNYSHRALPKASTRNRRDPITDAELAQLRDTAVTTSPDPFVRKRRLVMLRLLEITGARRGEAAKVTVGAVHAAARSSCPVLLVNTLKQDVPDSSREIPISRLDAAFFNDFSEQVRSRRLRKIGLRSDPDQPLLVNARTGMGLRENTITQEVRDLGIAAGISRKISPHLFRHRYITSRMSALIEHLKASFPDEFHKGLIDPDSLKHKVAELSGHRSVQSLDVYLHLSLERLYGVTDADATVRASDAIESFILQVHALQAALECDDSKERRSASSDLLKLASDFLAVVKDKL